ncbi:MAG: DUF4192 domain-containing protein [Lapillicoccus sp.]
MTRHRRPRTGIPRRGSTRAAAGGRVSEGPEAVGRGRPFVGEDDGGGVTRIRLRGPGDVIATLPYHLGYQPEESLVLVCLDGSRLSFVGRIDLPPSGVDPRPIADELLAIVLRESPERVLVLGFETTPGQSAPLSALVAGVLRDDGIDVPDRLAIREGRYWSLDCDGPCCPPEGQPVPEDSQVPAVADYVLLGRHPAPSRAALDEPLRPDDDVADLLDRALVLARRHQDAVRARPDHRTRDIPEPLGSSGSTGSSGSSDLAELRRTALTAWARLVDVRDVGGATFPDETWLLLGGSLRDVHLRDLLIAWLCPGTLELDALDPDLVALALQLLPESPPGHSGTAGWGASEEGRELVEQRLMMLCRRTPVALSAAPLTVLASHTWWHGNGALTRTALDRALQHEPDYRLALLLERMVDLAIRPPHPAV